MAQHLVELTHTLLKCEYLSVVLLEPEEDHLHLLAIAGASKEQKYVRTTTLEHLFLHDALEAESLSCLHEGVTTLTTPSNSPLLQGIHSTNVQKVILAPLKKGFPPNLSLLDTASEVRRDSRVLRVVAQAVSRSPDDLAHQKSCRPVLDRLCAHARHGR